MDFATKHPLLFFSTAKKQSWNIIICGGGSFPGAVAEAVARWAVTKNSFRSTALKRLLTIH